MATDTIQLTEVLYMASIYRSHHMYDFAIRMLREFIQARKKYSARDFEPLALAQYYLAEIYSDQGNYIIARELYKRAADNWQHCFCPTDLTPAIMWYSNALHNLQKQTDKLILYAHTGRIQQNTA